MHRTHTLDTKSLKNKHFQNNMMQKSDICLVNAFIWINDLAPDSSRGKEPNQVSYSLQRATVLHISNTQRIVEV